VSCAAFSADGALVATGSWDSTVRLWEVGGKKEQAVLGEHPGGVRTLAFTPDGKTLVTAGEDKTVRLWDTKTRREKATLQGHNLAIYTLAVSPDGKLLATGGGNYKERIAGELKLWDLGSGKELRSFPVSRHTCGLVFSPDSKTLIASIGDGSTQVLDLATGQAQATLRTPYVGPVALTADGKTLATGQGSREVEGTIPLWDTGTWQQRAVVRGHQGQVAAVAFSPDGRTLVTTGHDTTVKLWPVPGGAAMEAVRK
jgi:WD40 repeat protein